MSDGGGTLSLRWEGVPLPPAYGGVQLVVTVNISILPGGKPGVALRGSVAQVREPGV
eukprot:COSAG02_NODE_61580_length_268_cov_0.615385_1_plen_56_part_01